MRPARHIWMASDRKDADLAGIRVVRKLPVEIIEVVPPNIFDIPRIYPAVAVGTVLDEHHRREIIDIPASRDLDKAGLLASDQRLHPSFGFLRVVDFCPGITSPQPVHVGYRSISERKSRIRGKREESTHRRRATLSGRIRCRSSASARRLRGLFPTY